MARVGFRGAVVDFEFSSARWKRLSNKERIAECLSAAERAEKTGHDAIARQWRLHAAEIEAQEPNSNAP